MGIKTSLISQTPTINRGATGSLANQRVNSPLDVACRFIEHCRRQPIYRARPGCRFSLSLAVAQAREKGQQPGIIGRYNDGYEPAGSHDKRSSPR